MDRVFDEFLEYKRDVLSRSQETVERIRYTYRRFMTEEIRQRKMSSITETELMRYVRLIVDTEHPKERALKSFLQMIHGLFRFGYDNHYTSSDVSKRIVAENFYKDCDCSKKEAGEKIFSPAEIHLIREAANQKLPNPRAFMILLAIETGMRAGELCALHWDDISETDIHIHRQQLLRTRNGKREGFYEVPYTKDKRRHPHGVRYFPLTTRCRQLLDQLRTSCGSSSEYVFSEEGEWIHKTSYEQFLKRLCKNLDLSITNNHAFRMSLNSNVLIKAGLDAKTRAAILGHSIATNESYYTYTRRDEIPAVGSTIDQFTTVIG
jgi:integrase